MNIFCIYTTSCKHRKIYNIFHSLNQIQWCLFSNLCTCNNNSVCSV